MYAIMWQNLRKEGDLRRRERIVGGQRQAVHTHD